MAQVLQIGSGYVTVDQHFRGASILPKRAMVGGDIVTMAEGQPAPPDVVRVKDAYYYMGNPLTPVADPAHLAHLPEPHRTRALRFIEQNAKKPAPVIRPRKDEAKEKARAARTSKPARTRTIRNAKDLHRESGGVTVERAQRAIEKT
jgi:hypothetical protein